VSAGTRRDVAVDRTPRRGYLDWLRGVAVLIMIEAHLLDSWTGGPDRQTTAFGIAIVVGGMGAPLFLLLAGVSVSLSAASKFRRMSDARAAAATVMRRGFQIFGLAFLFRIQAWILGWGLPRDLLKVDILNIMGPSIVLAAAVWGAARSTRRRAVAFAGVTALIAVVTPLVRTAPIAALPDPIEAYLRPAGHLANFVFFPWAGFLFAGALAGVLLEQTTGARESKLNAWLFFGGLSVTGLSFAASYLPSPYPVSGFWTSSPCYFFLRAGLLTAAIGAAYAWESRPGGAATWSPVRQLGRTSLFIYWIHVEMVYGLISRPLHKGLMLPQALLAFALFALFMLGCSIAKEKVMAGGKSVRLKPEATRRPEPTS
jgi:uncharacterized membrane protein